MAIDVLGTIRLFLKDIASRRYPGAGLFAMTSERDVVEADARAGDTVVYTGAAPAPSQAVVWSTNGGKLQVGCLQNGGRVLSAGATVRAEKVRGVVVANIRKF